MSDLLSRYELHRRGLGLLTRGDGDETVMAIYLTREGARPYRSCSCPLGRRRTCSHLKQISKAARQLERRYRDRSWEATFSATVWWRLAKLLQEGSRQPCAATRISRSCGRDRQQLRVTNDRRQELALYHEGSPAQVHFLERIGAAQQIPELLHRAGLLDRLAALQATPEEIRLNQLGMETNRQVWEQSFWYRLAYHCVRELGEEAGSFHPAVDPESGDFHLTYRLDDGRPVVRITLPRNRVRAVLELLQTAYPEQQDLAIHPVPLRTLFHVSQETELDVEVRPVIQSLQERGEARFYSGAELERYRYGSLVYVRELGVLAELERPGNERRFHAPARMRLERSEVPSFLDEHRQAIEEGELVLDEALRDLRVFRDYDRVEIAADGQSSSDGALDRSWYWLSVRYRFGPVAVSLGDLLAARERGEAFFETPEGWIDLDALRLAELDALRNRQEGEEEASTDRPSSERLRLSAGELLRLRAQTDKEVAVGGEGERADILRRFLELRPASPLVAPHGMTGELRQYQQLGVDWLRFLAENRLGGLLCDDMGLGKTHQAMALMLSLREQDGIEEPFLVVCPRSVISHWRNKIRDYSPGLDATIYHGPQRHQLPDLASTDVVVTSYGVLRRDSEELCRIRFAAVILDEVQHLKNRHTLAFEAAVRLVAGVKIGLTGTPIENRLEELKAIFDLTLPGYLGSDDQFAERYAPRGEEEPDVREVGHHLRRIIAPFVLRRLKSTVIEELPEKIEDLRTCALSETQAELYRAAIAGRGAALVERLEDSSSPPPYIHVFALLNLLKQICDHPALALRQLEQADELASGKWDLFCELLHESLDSGQKVVVFTQYLGMITLMRRHLESLGIDGVVLTGSTMKRGAVVERFNTEPECRVFLGSLRAGGTGIDLVGGSVVIHYDRWWNAAREDQATDRVHRIGQSRAVQVFKLVTEGTLEEKIAAIIDRKRELMESVVQEDNPRLAKMFTRDDLLDLLVAP